MVFVVLLQQRRYAKRQVRSQFAAQFMNSWKEQKNYIPNIFDLIGKGDWLCAWAMYANSLIKCSYSLKRVITYIILILLIN